MNSGDYFISDSDLMFTLSHNIPESVHSLLFTSKLFNSDGSFLGINPPYFPKSRTLFFFLSRFFPSLFWPCHQSIVFLRSTHILYPYDARSIGSDRKVILTFLNLPYLSFNRSISHFSLDGISSTGPLNIHQLRKQVVDSLLLLDFRRVLVLLLKFLLNILKLQSILQVLRIFRYRLISPFFIFLFRRFKL